MYMVCTFFPKVIEKQQISPKVEYNMYILDHTPHSFSITVERIQLANHTGYIKVDWQRVEKDVKKAKAQLKIRKSQQTPAEVKSKAEEVRLILFRFNVWKRAGSCVHDYLLSGMESFMMTKTVVCGDKSFCLYVYLCKYRSQCACTYATHSHKKRASAHNAGPQATIDVKSRPKFLP